MRPMGLNEIREKYLSFFESKGHLRRESFPLVPIGDSSLLLINSGMAPLKPYFSGDAQPPSKRMTTCQKCIRTPDIERVGKTSRHCTFFEMLGHFSFGDYFKREAIKWTWEFFTQVMGIDPELLYCSVYVDDDEAWDIWTGEVGVDPSHMARLGKDDNFWEIGAGPCGPSSEIYFDRGPEKGCGSPDCKVGCDCDRFVEIGNNVFTQFNNDGEGHYTPLAQKNIDFGMGLERLACVVQGVDNVFEVDTIKRIRERVCETAGIRYRASDSADVSIRIITDHIRSTVMLVSDGVLPSNEGRGYVLRRLLRRAARHGRLLGVTRPFLAELSETVIAESCGAYPELERKKEYIQRVISIEEDRFATTIDAGMRLLAEEIEKIRDGVFPGAAAFKLYDTFGFPVDLTAEILADAGLSLSRAAFDALMTGQREKARAARSAMGAAGWASLDLGLDKSVHTEFTGYEHLSDEGTVIAILADGALADTADEGQEATLVLDRTPFYAESGGQAADAGTITGPGGVFSVRDVRKTGDGKYLHIGVVGAGEFSTGQAVRAAVDAPRRRAIMRAHSATHLLQQALREVLGGHVEQAGSYVEPDRLRFDFTHLSAMTPEEIFRTNRMVNEKILEGLPVEISHMPLAEAKKLGAMALFGEKYGETVRVVRMGGYSTELCGGTHLSNTSLAGSFFLRSESSVSAGVRRIEARTGMGVIEQAEETAVLTSGLASVFKTGVSELRERIMSYMDEHRETLRELSELRRKAAGGEAERYLSSYKNVAGLKVVTAAVGPVDTDKLRQMGDWLRDRDPGVVAVLCSVAGEKVTFFAVCGSEAVARGVKAGALIGAVTRVCGGSGGGKPESAMGGGKDPLKVDDALAAAEGFVMSAVNVSPEI